MLLKGVNIFLTGGSRGIGKAAVIELAKNGANVAFTYLSNKEGAENVKKAAGEASPSSAIRYYQLDVKDSKQVESVAEKAIADMGRIDVVVNNAGIVRDAPVFYITDEQWHEVVQTNLTGVFYVCRAFLEEFIVNKGGKFINISSVSHMGSAGQANYSASKAGLIGLSKTIAKEYGHKNIYCNVIVPGIFRTDMTENNMAQMSKAVSLSALQREGRPDEFAKAVVFLASGLSSYVNGDVLNVSGGLDAIPPFYEKRKPK